MVQIPGPPLPKQGHTPITKSFLSKADAELWAKQMEMSLEIDGMGIMPRTHKSPPLSDLLFRYSQEITPKKRGADVEQYRIQTILRHKIAQIPINKLTSSAVAKYRDDRLEDVSSSSVRRELVILRHCLEIARKEWNAPLKANPVKDIRLPSDGKARNRRLSSEEFETLLKAVERCRNSLIKPVVLFGLATGMRRGEILALTWKDINRELRTAKIRESKNGESRTIPLSQAALDALDLCPTATGRIFPLTANAFRQAWERAVARSGIEDLHFHDLRHEAISTFFELGLNVPEVSMISGHKDPRMLFRYTHPKAAEVAKRLKA